MDNKGLENLPVYGDLLKIYSLPLVNATISEAGNLFIELQTLENRLLTLYASYVAARSGFYVEYWANEDAEPPMFSTEFKDADWIKNLDLLEPFETGALVAPRMCFEWDMPYKNEPDQNLKLVFVTGFLVEMVNNKLEDSATHYSKLIDPLCLTYIIVHPMTLRRGGESFKEIKEELKKALGKDIFLSTSEFVSRMIPNEQERHVVEENWALLRDKLVANLQKERPVLMYATHYQQLSEAAEQIRQSKVKYDTLDFADAIKDAGVACESLLQILYEVYVSEKKTTEVEFYDLMCIMKDILIEKFGANIFQDLEFIRIWRNNVVHPRRERPDWSIALQVITKAKLFNELFSRKILEVRR